MPVTQFPDPWETDTSDTDGILALGGDLHPRSLVLAYSRGIFPWPIEGYPLAWFCPEERAILEFSRLHIPRSLERARRKTPFQFTLDQDFEGVITECSRIRRKGQRGTWITPILKAAYIELHREGLAHSAEAWKEGKLVGGIYGVSIAGTFAGESMFHRENNASKLVLLHLIDHLRSRGLDWMDIQQLTPHMEALGAREVPKREFLDRLRKTQERKLTLF